MNIGKDKAIPCALLGTLLLAVEVLLTGCVKRELEVRPTSEMGRVELALDWEGVEERPAEVRFLFYGADGALAKEQTAHADGFAGELPAGTYRMVMHNTDALQVDYRGMDKHETAEVFARHTEYSRKSFERHEPGIPCILEPQFVYGAGICREFATIEVVAGQTTTATIAPRLLTRQLEFRFKVKAKAEVLTLAGVVNGVAPGVLLASGEHTTSSSCAVEFAASPVTRSTTNDYFTRLSVFNLLCTATSPDGTNTLQVYLALDNGYEFDTSIDITPTLRDIIVDNDGEIPIEIPIEVTLDATTIGDGLTATVKPWDDTGTGSGGIETE